LPFSPFLNLYSRHFIFFIFCLFLYILFLFALFILFLSYPPFSYLSFLVLFPFPPLLPSSFHFLHILSIPLYIILLCLLYPLPLLSSSSPILPSLTFPSLSFSPFLHFYLLNFIFFIFCLYLYIFFFFAFFILFLSYLPFSYLPCPFPPYSTSTFVILFSSYSLYSFIFCSSLPSLSSSSIILPSITFPSLPIFPFLHVYLRNFIFLIFCLFLYTLFRVTLLLIILPSSLHNLLTLYSSLNYFFIITLTSSFSVPSLFPSSLPSFLLYFFSSLTLCPFSLRFPLCKICGFHGGNYEECRLLGYKNPFRTSQETHYFSVTESTKLMLCKI
jgi:hypothetical protein